MCAAGTFAFGANIPKGFTHFVKQKPAGQLYVEYSVDCLRQVPACTELIMSWIAMNLYCWWCQGLQPTLHFHALRIPNCSLYNCVASYAPIPTADGIAAGATRMPPSTEGLSHREPKSDCISVGREMQGPWNVGLGTIRAAMQTGTNSLPVPWTSQCRWALDDSEVSGVLPSCTPRYHAAYLSIHHAFPMLLY